MGQPIVECSHGYWPAHLAYPVPFGEHIFQYPVDHGGLLWDYPVAYVGLRIYPPLYYTDHPINVSSCVQ